MSEASEEPTSEEPTSEEPTSESPSIDLEQLNLLRRVIIMAQGGDPEAQQTLNAFLKFSDNVERTNLPTRKDVHAISFLNLVDITYFPDIESPFAELVDCVARAFMALRGGKSDQFVELMKQTPSLTDLQTMQGPQDRSLTDRILRRGKEE